MQELIKQAFTVIFARGFIRMAQLISFVLLARFLTPAEFGYFGILTTAIALSVTLGSFGLWQALAYEIGQKRLSPGEAAATMLVIWPVLSALAVLAVQFLVGSGVAEIPAATVLAITTLGVSCAMLVQMTQGMFLGKGEIGRFSVAETLPRVLMASLVVALVALQLVSLNAALWAFSASFAFVAPLAMIFVLRGIEGFRPRFRRLPRMLLYGLAFASKVFLVTLNLRLGMFLLDHFSGPEAAGFFFAASRINEIFLEAAAAFGLVLFSRGVRADAGSVVMQQNARIACWMFWLFLIGGGAVAVLAPWVTPLLLGAGYESAAPLLQIMALALGPAAATKVISPAIAGQGRPWLGTFAMLPSVLVNLLLAFSLIGVFGLTGAAVALAVSHYVAFGIYAIVLNVTFNVRLDLIFVPSRADAVSVVQALRRLRFRKD